MRGIQPGLIRKFNTLFLKGELQRGGEEVRREEVTLDLEVKRGEEDLSEERCQK